MMQFCILTIFILLFGLFASLILAFFRFWIFSKMPAFIFTRKKSLAYLRTRGHFQSLPQIFAVFPFSPFDALHR